jgi:anti-sigma B factor antagonist
MPAHPLEIAREQLDGKLLLTADGYVDLSTRIKLSTALNDAVTDADGGVVIDLCGVEYVDTTGIGVLISALRRLTRQERSFRLVCPPGNVRRIFELSGLDGTFSLHDTREDALSG